mmetsp:Transcript_15728/g.29670  ORF Transcript_15728/g.29670 Transcript_15728/m.29670 type:complete len:701 (-) Transcript_15728:1141-3243(-)
MADTAVEGNEEAGVMSREGSGLSDDVVRRSPPTITPPIGPPYSNLYRVPGIPSVSKSTPLGPPTTPASIRESVSNLMQMRQGGIHPGQLSMTRPRGPPPISPNNVNGVPPRAFGNTMSPTRTMGSIMRGPPGQGPGISQGLGPPAGSILRGPPPRVQPPRGPPPILPQHFFPAPGPASSQISGSSAINQIKSNTTDQLPPSSRSRDHSPPVSKGPFTPVAKRTTNYMGKIDDLNDDIERQKNKKISLLIQKAENARAQQQRAHTNTTEPDIQSQSPVRMAPFGKLTVKIVQGKNLKAGHGVLGKASPFVQIKVGSNEVSTTVHRDGGKSPVWNSLFEFNITNEKEMSINVFDKGLVGRDIFMGKATINLLDWMAQGNYYGTVELLDHSGGLAGGLVVEALFHKIDKPNVDIDYNDPSQEFSDQQILEAFRSFDLDKNNYVGAAELRHILVSIGETVKDEEVDEMIKMVDKDGDGQVCFEEFYKMVTGGRKPPPSLGRRRNTEHFSPMRANLKSPINRRDSLAVAQAAAEARNTKRKILDEFAREQNLKPESIKSAHKRYLSMDKNKTGLINYIEFCDILQLDPSTKCENVFWHFDNRNTGMAEAKEILIALANSTGAGKDDKLKFSFLVYDEEKKGTITKMELIKILKANHMAKNDSEVYRKAETIMAQANKTEDGIMNFEEFMNVSKKFPNILFPSYTR